MFNEGNKLIEKEIIPLSLGADYAAQITAQLFTFSSGLSCTQ